MLVTVIIIHNKYIYIVELIPSMHSRPLWIKMSGKCIKYMQMKNQYTVQFND